MIANDALRWLLSAVFGGLSIFHLLRCLRLLSARSLTMPERWLSELMHLGMGLSMIVMIWPLGPTVPEVAWIVVFSVWTGWFLARAVSALSDRVALVLSAAGTGAMAWMVGSTPNPPSAGDHGGMEMPGMSHAAVGGAGWPGLLLGGCLVLSTFWWVGRDLRIGGPSSETNTRAAPLNWSKLCHGVMSAGMGIALLATG